MGTDKNKISAYLSDQDFSTLKTLAASYQVSKSQLVILAIRALAGQSVEVTPINLSSGVNAETMESLVKDEVSQAIAAALAPISEDLENLKKQISGLLTTPPPLPLETMNQAIAPALKELIPGEGLTGKELAERFGYGEGSPVTKNWKKGEDAFLLWSKGKDPDGYGWTKQGDKFFPVSD